MKKKIMKQMHKSALAALALAAIGLTASASFRPQAKADAVSMSVYPVNSRLSFRGKLASGNNGGNTMAVIDTNYDEATSVYSTSSATLQTGDIIRIGDHDYAVSFNSGPTNDNQIPLRTVLSDGDAAAGTAVYATMSGDIKVVYTAHAKDSTSTVNSVNPGRVEFLIPAAADQIGAGEYKKQYLLTADGLPDSGGFDFGSTENGGRAASIVAADTATFASCGQVSAKQQATMIGTTPYHMFYCEYTSPLNEGTEYVFTIKDLINPVPKAEWDIEHPGQVAPGRSLGSADAYAVRAYQKEFGASGIAGAYGAIRESVTYVGFSNGIKMTVRVMPQLTFKIAGIGEGVTACGGISTDVESDAYQIDFGSIGNTDFTKAAQKITVNTNAPHGYVITAIADDQMRISGQICPNNGVGYSQCIPGFADKVTPGPWVESSTTGGTTTYNSGFGYTLHIVDGDNYLNTAGQPNVQAAFDYADNQYWRSFADHQMEDNPIQLFNNLRSTSGDELEVCYKIMSAASNVPGNYMSALTYTITASF